MLNNFNKIIVAALFILWQVILQLGVDPKSFFALLVFIVLLCVSIFSFIIVPLRNAWKEKKKYTRKIKGRVIKIEYSTPYDKIIIETAQNKVELINVTNEIYSVNDEVYLQQSDGLNSEISIYQVKDDNLLVVNIMIGIGLLTFIILTHLSSLRHLN